MMRMRKIKRTKKLLAGLLALLLAVTAVPLYGMEVQAEDGELVEGDYQYKMNEDGESVMITKYVGIGGSITIPEEIAGKSVIKIGSFSFSGCYSLTKVTIPGNVVSIGEWAFSDCSGLSEITIQEGLAEIERYAFSDCSNLREIEIPGSVARIGEGILSGCSMVATVKVRTGNTVYHDGDCNAIIRTEDNTLIAGCKNTIIPEDVTRIGYYAFSGCNDLVDIIIPESVTKIDYYAFSDCSGLTGVEIPKNVTSIGEGAFLNCRGLTGVKIPSSVIDIKNMVFSNCSNLTRIEVEAGNTRYDSRKECNGIIETVTNTLIAGCKNTTIPESVTSIGSYAFYECNALTMIEIPDNIVSIGRSAFKGCSCLKNITISKNVTNIEWFTFSDCSNLTNVTIPENVQSVGNAAFRGCTGLTSVKISRGVESIGPFAFSKCSGLMSVEIPASVTDIGNRAFGYEYDEENDKYEKKPDFVIYGEAGSEAQTYAEENGFQFIMIGTPRDVSTATITLEKDSYPYDGTAKIPSVTVALDGTILTPDIDYTVAYVDNIGTGTARIIVTGKGNYTGNTEKTFVISKADLSTAVVTLEKTSYTYDGTAKTPSVTVTFNGKTLVANTDYILAYSDNVSVGTGKVVITGKGNYTGSVSKTFTINKIGDNSEDNSDNNNNNDSSNNNNSNNGTTQVISCKKKTYNLVYGAKAFKVNATSGGKMTWKSSDEKVASVDQNGKVTIKGTGIAYITVSTESDSVKITVKVSPRKQKIKSVKAASGRKLTVKWTKDKQATGYQVQLSVSRNFKKIAKKQNISKMSKNNCTFTKLKKGSKYYVRVRSYKKSGKTTLYGAWSNLKQSGKMKK